MTEGAAPAPDTGLPSVGQQKVSLREQAEEAARELTLRYRVYSARVRDGRMSEAEKERGLAAMRAIRDTLRLFAAHEDAIRAVIRAGLERQRLLAEAAELEQEPAVAAVLDAFPGAAITSVEPFPTDGG